MSKDQTKKPAKAPSAPSAGGINSTSQALSALTKQDKALQQVLNTASDALRGISKQDEAIKQLLNPDYGALNALKAQDEALKRAMQQISSIDLKSLAGITSSLSFPQVGIASDPQLVKLLGEFETEVANLKRKLKQQASTLENEQNLGESKQTEIEHLKEALNELEQTLGEYEAKRQEGFLLGRVNQEAQKKLLVSNEFREQFLPGKDCHAFILAADIRRSTELMLRAKSPEAFASFITELCEDLSEIIRSNYGVFDKFTGDGILAFFPDFYSGVDVATHAITAADQCHARWTDHYKSHRISFKSVLVDVGLGIGLDYGHVHLVQVAQGLTVVGEPVVYACRLSSAKAGVTLANQPAYEIISDRLGSKCLIEESPLEIKHEGSTLAYSVKSNGTRLSPAPPAWLQEHSD